MEKFSLRLANRGLTLMEIIRTARYTSHKEIIEKLNMGKDEVYETLIELSGNGFKFDTHPHAGVRLIDIPDLLTPELIGNSLHTEKIGKRIYYLPSTHSTNSKAIDLALQGEPEGTLVVTEYQSGGRGRLGRKWKSPSWASILATLVLRPISTSLIPLAVLTTALSIVESLRKIGMDAHIRWPNDIIVKGRKICGILGESGMNYMVCGFGLNANQDSFSTELPLSTTSMRIELHRFHSRPVILRSILQKFEEHYEKLLSGCTQEILESIREVSWLIGKRVKLTSGNSIVTGRVLDIDDSGSLVLKKDCGNILQILPQRASVLNG